VEGEGRDKGSQVARAANLAATTHSATVRRRMFVFRDDLRQINMLNNATKAVKKEKGNTTSSKHKYKKGNKNAHGTDSKTATPQSRWKL